MQAYKSCLSAICLGLLLLVQPTTALAQMPGPPHATVATNFCPALAPSTGHIVEVDSVSELVDAVNQAASGDVILIADGVYELNGAYLRIDVDNVTLRSASGNREAVVLDGNYDTTEIIQVVASNITIADITLREAYNHPIHVTSTETADTLNTLIYNVHIIDPGEQAIKINPYAATGVLHFTDDGVIACSHIELTDVGRTQVRGCYTGGVDAHQSENWVIRDNMVEGFWCDSGLSEHAIHMWRSCRNTTVERNVLHDNARGVGFGLVTDGSGIRTYADNPCPSASGYVDDYGGIIRNNFIVANDPDLFASEYGFDCGICLWNSCNSSALHNTIYTANPEHTFSAMEWRFPNTLATITNNLTNDTIRERDDASATQSGNLTNGQANWFVNTAANDLHLVATASEALDQVEAPTGVSTDIDGDIRPIGAASDVGADEYGIAAPAAVTDLRVAQALHAGNSLTATLRWTPPSGADTTVIHWAAVPITEENWPAATLLIESLAGDAGEYQAVVPYTGGTRYFALKTTGAGGESPLSNVAFWPSRQVYLPLVLRQ
ncbi:MAG: hypothetical protein JXA21_05030 [Anaerolineae bacterium]|nr:hypothetical protein [Anaerolineae bacterium]